MSIAVDTNVILRAVVGDDPRQATIARETLARGFSVSASVLVEVEWILRSSYRWPRLAIATALTGLLDLPAIDGAPSDIGWAVERYGAGADFADAVHLISAKSAQAFATFDRRLAVHAGPDTPLPIETLA